MWGTRGFPLTPRVRKWVGHPGFPDLISVGGSDRYLEVALAKRASRSDASWRNYRIWNLFSHTVSSIHSRVSKRISMIESLKLVACFTAVVLSGILLPAFSFCWVTVSKFPRLLSEGSSGWPKQPIDDFLFHVINFSEEVSTHPQPWAWHQRQNLWKNSLAPCTLAGHGWVVKTDHNKIWTFCLKITKPLTENLFLSSETQV